MSEAKRQKGEFKVDENERERERKEKMPLEERGLAEKKEGVMFNEKETTARE